VYNVRSLYITYCTFICVISIFLRKSRLDRYCQSLVTPIHKKRTSFHLPLSTSMCEFFRSTFQHLGGNYFHSTSWFNPRDIERDINNGNIRVLQNVYKFSYISSFLKLFFLVLHPSSICFESWIFISFMNCTDCLAPRPRTSPSRISRDFSLNFMFARILGVGFQCCVVPAVSFFGRS